MSNYEDERRMNKYPLPHKLYKGVKGKYGAFRLALKKAYTSPDKDYGCVFLEMAPAIGPNQYDWEVGKIVFKLDLTDIGKIIHFLRSPSSFPSKDNAGTYDLMIYHDRGAGTSTRGEVATTLKFYKSPEMHSIMVSLIMKDHGVKKDAKVPLSADEAIVIGTLLQAAIPLIVSWTS